jgi:hypothetical protein
MAELYRRIKLFWFPKPSEREMLLAAYRYADKRTRRR